MACKLDFWHIAGSVKSHEKSPAYVKDTRAVISRNVWLGVATVENEIFKGIVVFENEFAVICEPRELNTAINEAYKMQKDVEKLMIVIV